jgi:hypothetical protein
MGAGFIDAGFMSAVFYSPSAGDDLLVPWSPTVSPGRDHVHTEPQRGKLMLESSRPRRRRIYRLAGAASVAVLVASASPANAADGWRNVASMTVNAQRGGAYLAGSFGPGQIPDALQVRARGLTDNTRAAGQWYVYCDVPVTEEPAEETGGSQLWVVEGRERSVAEVDLPDNARGCYFEMYLGRNPLARGRVKLVLAVAEGDPEPARIERGRR